VYLNRIIIFFIIYISFTFSVDTVGININQTDIELSSSVEINKPNFKKKQHRRYYTKYLVDTYYIHTNGNNLLSIGISGNNNFYTSDIVSFGFGMKSIFAENTLALPFYGKAMISVPHSKGSMLPTVSIIGMLAYAPSILSMIDSKEYIEVRGEADVEIIPKIHLFTGYRKIDIRYKTFDRVFNDSVYAGMKFNF